MWRGHGGTRDGVYGSLASDPSRLDVQSRGEDINTLSIVGEISPLVTESGSTDGDSFCGGSR